MSALHVEGSARPGNDPPSGVVRPELPVSGQQAIRRLLEARGIAVTDEELDELPGAPWVGHRAHLESCELSFRLEESGWLFLLHYRRVEPAGSLRSPFADLVAFLLLATREELGVRRVMGQIRTEPLADGRGLSDARLTRCYERLFGTRRTRYDAGEWLYSDIAPLRARLPRLRHHAASWCG